eukprot:SAG31_NODE_36267_length_315_cov_0.694444_1_plen_43_part_10
MSEMLRTAASGMVATFIGDLAMFPIDTVKPMQQGPDAGLSMLA